MARMNTFDILIAVDLITVLVALLRGRPAILMFSGNALLVLRALSNIQDFGQPTSQSFVPGMVFQQQNLNTAAQVLAVPVVLFLAASLAPSKAARSNASLPPVPRWVLYLIGLYLVLFIFSSKTIIQNAYTDPDRAVFGFTIGGAHTLLMAVILYELFRRVRSGEMRPVVAWAIVFVICLLSDFAKGSTGLAAGIVVTGTVLVWNARKVRFGGLRASAAIALLLVVVVLVRTVRSFLHDEGTSAIAQAYDGIQEGEASRSRTGEGFETHANAEQYAAHTLECITLFDTGHSREWRSIYNVVEYTLKPAFLMEPLGLERSRDAPWELGDSFIHGGGIFMFGELYWNGGMPCVLIITMALALFSYTVDTRYASSFGWLMMCCNFCGGLLQGVGYGFNQVCRGIINGLLVLVIVWACRMLRGFRSPDHAMPQTTRT